MDPDTLQTITSILGDLGFLGFAVYMLINERNAHQVTRESARADLERRHTEHREEIRELRREYETTLQEMHRRRDELTREILNRFLGTASPPARSQNMTTIPPSVLPEQKSPKFDDTRPYVPLEPET